MFCRYNPIGSLAPKDHIPLIINISMRPPYLLGEHLSFLHPQEPQMLHSNYKKMPDFLVFYTTRVSFMSYPPVND